MKLRHCRGRRCAYLRRKIAHVRRVYRIRRARHLRARRRAARFRAHYRRLKRTYHSLVRSVRHLRRHHRSVPRVLKHRLHKVRHHIYRASRNYWKRRTIHSRRRYLKLRRSIIWRKKHGKRVSGHLRYHYKRSKHIYRVCRHRYSRYGRRAVRARRIRHLIHKLRHRLVRIKSRGGRRAAHKIKHIRRRIRILHRRLHGHHHGRRHKHHHGSRAMRHYRHRIHHIRKRIHYYRKIHNFKVVHALHRKLHHLRALYRRAVIKYRRFRIRHRRAHHHKHHFHGHIGRGTRRVLTKAGQIMNRLKSVLHNAKDNVKLHRISHIQRRILKARASMLKRSKAIHRLTVRANRMLAKSQYELSHSKLHAVGKMDHKKAIKLQHRANVRLAAAKRRQARIERYISRLEKKRNVVLDQLRARLPETMRTEASQLLATYNAAEANQKVATVQQLQPVPTQPYSPPNTAATPTASVAGHSYLTKPDQGMTGAQADHFLNRLREENKHRNFATAEMDKMFTTASAPARH